MTGKRVQVRDTERSDNPHRQQCLNDAVAIEKKTRFLSRSAIGQQRLSARSDFMALGESPLAIEIRQGSSRHVMARRPEAMQRLAMRGR